MNPYVTIVSECLVVADSKPPSSIQTLRLTVSDLPMLALQYPQLGCLFSCKAPNSASEHLKHSLSKTLSVFPPLAGRLSTDSASGHISIVCSNAGALFVHARASSIRLKDVFSGDVPPPLFSLNGTISFDGHSGPIVAVQFTELADSLFVACSINHAVVDAFSFSHFFNTFAAICRHGRSSLPPPCFSRDNVFFTDVAIRFPGGRPTEDLVSDEPIREGTFHFSRRAILAMKERANENYNAISSYKSLCAFLWRSVTRVRKLEPRKTTTFRMAMNCRSRVNPKMDPWYFGNAVQIVRTTALAGEMVMRELGWSANLLQRSVEAHDDRAVRKRVEEWEKNPHCFPLGSLEEGGISMGSSPQFPVYDNDFGWGRPVAVRTGKAWKCDGRVLAFPGREGDGSVDLRVWLKLASMEALENDHEFIYYLKFTSAL